MSPAFSPEMKTPHYPFRQLIKDVWSFIRPYKTKFWLASLLRLSTDIVWLYPPYALAKIVDLLASNPGPETLTEIWKILIIWIILAAFHYNGKNVATYYGYQVGERAMLDAQLKTMKHLFLVDLSWHEKENTGNKIKRMQNGGQSLDKLSRIWIDTFLQVAVHLVGMPIILLKMDLTIGLITIFFLVTQFTIAHFLSIRTARASHIVNVKEEEVLGLSFEAANNIRSVKVMGMTDSIFKILQTGVADLFEKIRHRIFLYRFRSALLGTYAQIFRLGVTIYLVHAILDGRYEVGIIVLFSSYFYYLWDGISQLQELTQDIMIAKFGVSRMRDILNEPVKIENERGKIAFPNDWQKISVKNLNFSYGQQPVLQDLSFEIKRGQKIGIVGLSGAGKSTILKLLLKENESYQGEILIDDIPLNKIKKSSYLKEAAVVLQDTEVFNFSLKENITITESKEASESRLRKALEVAHVTDYLEKLPQGVDTLIGEKGVKLSGGEKQRLGIARAIYRKPQLLFMDEATSHLDIESEHKIQDSLHQFFQEVTAIVIAHRLTTIREMDRILVLDNGQIVEEGSFEELQKQKGVFYELWEKQKL